LADLWNSCDVVREMRIVPFGLENVTRLAIAAATPLLPLVLTIFFDQTSRGPSNQNRFPITFAPAVRLASCGDADRLVAFRGVSW
jgi:hypothetical protein